VNVGEVGELVVGLDFDQLVAVPFLDLGQQHVVRGVGGLDQALAVQVLVSLEEGE